MIPTFDSAGLGKLRASEHALRFAFGGIATAIAGLLAQRFGPSLGGLFLAFPAILPASLTLVARHDSRRDAAENARGAIVGALALIAFATAVLALARHGPALALGSATAAWTVSATAGWAVWFGRR